MKAEGQENIINLLRCAWAGSQKYGALVWSGDIKSSFPSMKNQVAAGLNMGIAGIPWWTTDIGGFFGANINDPEFHELLVRWFEYGCFCPVMRLHGYRWPLQPQYGTTGGATCVSGAPNEVWSYTDQVCEILSDYLRLRERMLPYITELMEEAHEKGTPVMRPLFYDFPEDKESWNVETEYMFGPKVLVKPITDADARETDVYLPGGASWTNAWTGETFEGGQKVHVAAPDRADSIVYKRWLQTADEIKKFKDQEGVAELSRDNFRHPFKEHLTVSPMIQMDDKGEEKMGKAANSSISLKQIHVTDNFWNKYVHLVKDVIIPYQWDILNDKLEDVETSHCIENFKIAAGEKEGEFQGAVFQDTDVAKWLEAVGFVLNYERDEKLEELADETIELIGRAQQPDGYLNTYFTIKEPDGRWSNLMEGHELYTAGHMIEAAVAYYEATGKRRFLEIVSKFADLVCQTFGPEEGKIHGYPGHQEIELALVKLYRVTREKKYLDLAKYFIDLRGTGKNYFLEEEKRPGHKRIFPDFVNYDTMYAQAHKPVRKQRTAEGHAVRANYMYSAMADLAYEYQDKELQQACRNLWDNMVHKRMYITGSVGSSGFLERFTTDYDLPNDSNYSETCATIALAMFGKRMADMEKDASYMDVVERALYNTLLSGIAMDGKSFFYVNPLEVWPVSCMPRTSREHVKPVRQKWFGVACCPPNITRTLASLGQYIYFQEENEIYVNLYVANETEVTLNGVPFKITLKGNFPWENKMTVSVDGVQETEAMIAFRVPAYAENFKILRNGKEENLTEDHGYIKISGKMYKETFEISFDAEPVFVHANPQVRVDSAKVAVVKGPLVYCVEEADNGENLSSVMVNTDQKIEETYDDELLEGCSVLHITGKKISEKGWNEGILYQNRKVELEDVKLTLVPYCYWGNRENGEMLVWMKELFYM